MNRFARFCMLALALCLVSSVALGARHKSAAPKPKPAPQKELVFSGSDAFAQADAAYEAGRFIVAKALCESALSAMAQDDPQRPDGEYKYAVLLAKMKEEERALERLQKYPPKLFELAKYFEAAGKKTWAIRAYTGFYEVAREGDKNMALEPMRKIIAGLDDKSLETFAENNPSCPEANYSWTVLSERKATPEASPKKESVLSARVTVDEKEPKTLGRIGVLLPLEGKLAPFGKKVLNGVVLGSRLLSEDGKGIFELVIRDSGDDPETSQNAVEELAREGVLAIVGPLKGDQAKAAGKAARKAGIALISITPAEDVAGDGVFRLYMNEAEEVQSVVDYAMTSMNLKKFAFMGPDNDQGKRYRALFIAAVKERKAELVGEGFFEAGDNPSLAEPIRKVLGVKPRPKAKKPSKDEPRTELEGPVIRPEMVGVFMPVSSQLAGKLAPLFPYYDADHVRLLGTRAWNYPALLEVGGSFVEGCAFPVEWHRWNEAGREFFEAYQAAYESDPGALEAYGYDAVTLATRLAESEKSPTAKKMLDDLNKLKEFDAVTGPLQKDQAGNLSPKPKILRVKDGQVTAGE